MTTLHNSQNLDVQKSVLNNGLRIVTSEIPHARSTSIGLFVGVGSRYESEDQAGISHFIEHMVFKGTRNRPTPGEISGLIEGVGGILNASTEQELTLYWCKIPKFHIDDSLDLLFDILREPLFDSKAVKNERMVVNEELNMINDDPNYRVDALIDEMLWPNHQLGREIAGNKESVASITDNMMLQYMDENYTPNNMVVSLAGAVSHEDIVQQVTSLCKNWAPKPPLTPNPVTKETYGSEIRVEFRKTEQTHISIAVPGLSIQHPQKYALHLLSVILGEGMSSRLFIELRETRGLAYDIHSGIIEFMDSGAFVVSAGVEPKRVYDATQAIIEQLNGMKNEVLEEELERAQRLVTGRLLMRMEDNWTIANWIGNQELLLRKIASISEITNAITDVNPKDIEKLANTILVNNRLKMAVVGPCRGLKKLDRLVNL